MFGFFKTNKALKQIEKLSTARRFDEAEAMLKTLLEKAPHDAQLLLHATVVAFEKGAVEQSKQLAETALKTQPDNPVMHLALGEIQLRLNDNAGSMQSLHRSLELSPDNPKAEYLLGLNCIALKHYEEAALHFEKVARDDREFLMARLLTIAETWAINHKM